MWRFLKSPLVRISFGLTMLTVSMLLIADFLGLAPDTKSAALQSRKVIVESIAVQLSIETVDRQLHSVEEILRSVVGRNSSILSGAVRLRAGDLLSEYGNHGKYWTLQPGDRSTATQVQVPLYNEEGHWGNVELRFKALANKGGLLSFRSSFLTVILFMALAGFLAYLLFLKRTLRELNPDAVIPERVRKALDTLAEGLLIVDINGYIIFSNIVFACKTGLKPKQLVGKESAGFDWEIDSVENDNRELPWIRVLEGQEVPKGTRVRLKTALEATYTFTVNVSPITASADKIMGALITFDDITEIETKNEELRRTLGKLEKSQREISRQNQELLVLATRDPLTGILNRRSLFQGFETLFKEALEECGELSCIMVDIDHFKLVNDRFGHPVGDEVIKLLAKILTEHSRPNDLVGRFGGEEFLIVSPGVDSDIAAGIAERMRSAIQEEGGGESSSLPQITSSFGVATLSGGVHHHKELLEQADKALYAAKEAGRNRVIKWSSTWEGGAPQEEFKSATEQRPADDVGALSDGQREGVEEKSQLVQPGFDQSQGQDAKVVRIHPQGTNELQVAQQNEKMLLDPPRLSDEVYLSSNILLVDRIDQAIKRAQRSGTHIAVMVINIDALQRVSDTLGLTVNEKFAKIIVARLKQVLRLTDTVALTEESELLSSVFLLGRSEIIILLTDLKQSEIVTTILQRIFTMNNEPVEVEGSEFYLNPNIGVSLFPFDGADPDTLIRHASSAMREAKQNLGRKSFQFYADDINRQSKKQIRLEAELHHALERDELIVYYQPKVDLRNGKIVGMEALLRWQHPQLGLVPPDDFIPLAEQIGLIEEIDQWVLESVCRQIRFWQEAGFDTVKVAINLSPLEFMNLDLGNQIIRLVEDYGVPASAIELEVTETAVIQNMDTAVAILQSLNDAGFGISVDDFGTGYSSLDYLKLFPLSKVKIDRSFISDFMAGSNDAAIVSAIIAMSHSLGLRVVAEGVETEEQLRFLQDLHCDEIQGYLISRPVPREEAEDLLAQPSSIRRMILEYGGNASGLKKHEGASPASGMIGILNDFPVKDVGRYGLSNHDRQASELIESVKGSV